MSEPMRPLDGVLIVDFSQFLAGPMAAMRLGDLGARVIKVEKPVSGDIGRDLAFGGIRIDGDTLSFHITNRNKESYAANLKEGEDLRKVEKIISQADVLIQNFRPGVMERLGLGYDQVKEINPRIVYASVTGYGESGPWATRPGQDLLAQSISGLPWLNGSKDSPPIPVGIALADIITSIHLAHGVTAALLHREKTGQGSRVDTSLLESMIDLQFELLSAHLTDNSVKVNRGPRYSAHAFLQAPYGVYPTSDGYIALAMGSVTELGRLISLEDLTQFEAPDSWWEKQDEITALLARHLSGHSTDHWLELLDAADFWCAPVLTLPALVDHPGFSHIDATQKVSRAGADGSEVEVTTTRAPVRFNSLPLRQPTGAPRVGEHNENLEREFLGGQK